MNTYPTIEVRPEFGPHRHLAAFSEDGYWYLMPKAYFLAQDDEKTILEADVVSDTQDYEEEKAASENEQTDHFPTQREGMLVIK